jgi:ferrous iron transport protein B|tara:strand:- start:32300 stop:34630 length:2331 start_codon:yes stop_codon:yes gene_type:complete
MTDFTIALAGNPNSGKTTIFNALTGTRQKIGNWPGVTVERKSGTFQHAGGSIEVVDLPGTYALHIGHQNDSIDEQIAQDFILSADVHLVLNIIDAASLERGMYLTTQLLDADIPVVVALNMMDVADKHGIHIDTFALSQRLKCPVVPLVASREEGIGALVDAVTAEAGKLDDISASFIKLSDTLEADLATLLDMMDEERPSRGSRMLACALLEGDREALARFSAPLQPRLESHIESISSNHAESNFHRLTAARYQWIDDTNDSITSKTTIKHTLTDYLDALFLNRLLAFPLFLGVMYLMFMFTINLGSAFIDFFDLMGSALFVEGPRALLTQLNFPTWVIVVLADGLGGGVKLVGTFIPVIGCLFLFLSFLEDSGYMARAAFIIDRMMSGLGLPGKSFVPLIVGFGCNVPSIMATRTLEDRQDRLLTTIMAPYMSCGARLTVYALFAAAFFVDNGQNVVFGLYLIGIAMAAISGLVIRNFMLTNDRTPFIMELPPYHLPTIKGVLIQSWQRLKGFVVRAGKAIVVVVVVLNVVNSIGTDGTFGNQDSEKSVLSAIGKTMTPLFEPMGVKEDNWPATVGIFTGIFAKEVVVGTLDTLYANLAKAENASSAPEETFDFLATVNDAFFSIPVNLSQLIESADDPLGINIGDVSDAMTAAEAQEVHVSTLDLMNRLFDGELGAFSYLLFILLYIPCVATLGVIFKELGGFWALFSACWSLIMAYAVAVICYQLGNVLDHPIASLGWTAGMLALALSSYALLIVRGRQQARRERLIPVVNV